MKFRSRSRCAVLFACAMTIPAMVSHAQKPEALPADSTQALGQTFQGEKQADRLRVLLVGSGSSHHFPRDFIATDAKILSGEKGIETAATLQVEEALALLPQADVLVFSGNHEQYARGEFQQALHRFADQGKGIVLLHAATWVHPWTGYNQRFVMGGSTSHGYGECTVEVKAPEHPVMKGVAKTFSIVDESYHHKIGPGADIEVLAENQPDGQSPSPHASVWVVKDPKARIVCITLGHAREAHGNPAYQRILVNAVRWVSQR